MSDDEINPQEVPQTEQEEMTLPQKLRQWAIARELKQLDSRLLRQAANEIEMLRERVKTLQRENLELHEKPPAISSDVTSREDMIRDTHRPGGSHGVRW